MEWDTNKEPATVPQHAAAATVLRAPPVVNIGPCTQRKGTGVRALRALLSLQAPTGISGSF